MAESGQQELLSRTLLGGSEAVFEFTCQLCDGDKTAEAVGVCVDCGELMCNNCFSCHLKPTIMRDHKLLDIEEAIKDDNLKKYRDVCTEKCPQHPNEVVKFFCLDHGDMGCVACMTVCHRNCPGVKYIGDIAKDVAIGEECSGMMQELSSILARARDLIKSSTENKARSKATYDNVLEDIAQVQKDVTAAVSALAKEMKAEARKMTGSDTQKMDENIAKCDNIMCTAERLTSDLKRMKDNGQYCQLFCIMKTERLGTRSLRDQLNTVAEENNVTGYKFLAVKQLQDLVRSKDRLGKLEIVESQATRESEKGVKTDESPTPSSIPSLVSSPRVSQHTDIKNTVTKVSEIDVKTDNDSSKCRIVGVASLPRRRLVVSDLKNNKVKLVDVKQARVISELYIDMYVRDITTTDQTCELAVTTGYGSKIVLIKIRGDMLLWDRVIKTSGLCWGVAWAWDSLVVSLSSPERLEIIDKNGTVLRQIRHDKYGEQLFKDVLNVAVSQNMDTIYVPDRVTHTVTCLSPTGRVRAVYQNDELKTARGLAVGQGGVVYVGGQTSQNIHQITKDGQKISVLLTKKDGITVVCSLCYSPEDDHLYIGQASNTILVYKLS